MIDTKLYPTAALPENSFTYLGRMKALQFREKNSRLEAVEIQDPSPVDGEVKVYLVAAGFNRRDFWIMKGLYPNVQYPVVPGGDGAGTCDGRDVVIDAGIS